MDVLLIFFFFFNDTATTEIYTLSLHDALPIWLIPGPTFDASVLKTQEEQTRFHRNLTAVTAVLGGRGVREVAKESGMAPSTLSNLVQRTRTLGQIACAPQDRKSVV